MVMRTFELFEDGRPGYGEGYLIPRRRGALDVTVTAPVLQRSLAYFQELISCLQQRGHPVKVTPTRNKFERTPIDPRRGGDMRLPLRGKLWSPIHLTAVDFDGFGVGLSLFENCVLIEMRYVGFGRYEPAATRPAGSVVGNTWTQLMWLPSSKLELEAYSQRSESSWKVAWSELDNPRRFARTDAIVQELERLAAIEPKPLV
jgi:hypothetical protein